MKAKMFSQEIERVSHCLGKIKIGHKECIVELFDCLNAKLTFFAKQYLRDKSLVQDVLQDTVLNIMRYINSFDISKNAVNWVIKIVKNVAMKYNKNDGHGATVPIEDCELTSDEMIEEKISIKDTIIALGDEERNLFMLYFVYEYTMREIAGKLNMSKSNVSKRVVALKKRMVLKNE